MHAHVHCTADVKVDVTLNVNVIAYIIVTLLLLRLVVLLLTVVSIVVLILNINFDGRTCGGAVSAAAANGGGSTPCTCLGGAPERARWVLAGCAGMIVLISGAAPWAYSPAPPGELLRTWPGAAPMAPAVPDCCGRRLPRRP